jgi:hypothetical protein
MDSDEFERFRSRVDQIKSGLWDRAGNPESVQAGIQSALTVMSRIYGDPSRQLEGFQRWSERGAAVHDRLFDQYEHRVAKGIGDALEAALADHKAGITTSLKFQTAGAVLGDFVALARTTLAAHSEATGKVAAVLAAAALEETLKRLGQLNGVDVGARDLRGVIAKLRDANVLVGAQSGVALGYVKFRDYAFHGQFDMIDDLTTDGALAFVEGVITSRMS